MTYLSKPTKSHLTQLKKYGGEDGYRAEMKRRRSLVKTYALQKTPGLAREIANKRWKNARKLGDDSG